jgi:hypothetical protein
MVRLKIAAAVAAGVLAGARQPGPCRNAWTRLKLVCTGMAVDVVWSSLDEMAG